MARKLTATGAVLAAFVGLLSFGASASFEDVIATHQTDEPAAEHPAVAAGSSDSQAEFVLVSPEPALARNMPAPTPIPTPTPEPVVTAEPTVAPTVEPTVAPEVEHPEPESAQPVELELPPSPPAPAACPSVVTVDVLDAGLLSTVNTAISNWTEVFGCIKFEVVTSGAQVNALFGDVCWPGQRIPGCSRTSTSPKQVFVNPTCWPLTGQNARMITHELGHMIGFSDLDGNPYMTSSPPRPGTRYRADGVVVC
jgi:hypothetical protein